ncbi:unnamed protein product [Arctogadus glacialis]
MLLLSRAAWSSLCLAVVAMAAELTQDQVSWTRREGEAVSFRCTDTDQCYYIFWYQKKESETFTVILRIDKSNGNIYKGYNHPQKDDFSSVLKENSCELSLQKGIDVISKLLISADSITDSEQRFKIQDISLWASISLVAAPPWLLPTGQWSCPK